MRHVIPNQLLCSKLQIRIEQIRTQNICIDSQNEVNHLRKVFFVLTLLIGGKSCRFKSMYHVLSSSSFKIVVSLGPHTNVHFFWSFNNYVGPPTMIVGIIIFMSISPYFSLHHTIQKFIIYTKLTRRLNTEYGIEDV